MTTRGHAVYRAMETTIFEEISGLARELGAINLGQGFPDDALFDGLCGPPELIEAAARARQALEPVSALGRTARAS